MNYRTPIVHGSNQHLPIPENEELIVEAIPVSAEEDNQIEKMEDGLYVPPSRIKVPCLDVPGGIQPYYHGRYPAGPPAQPGLLGVKFLIPVGALTPNSPLPATASIGFRTGSKLQGENAVWEIEPDGLELVYPPTADQIDPLVQLEIEGGVGAYITITSFLSGLIEVYVEGWFYEVDTPVAGESTYVEELNLHGVVVTKVSTGESLLIPCTGGLTTSDFISEGEVYCVSAQARKVPPVG